MDGRLFDELLASTMIGGLAICLGPIFVLIQERTRATVGLALAWMTGGLALVVAPVFVDRVDPDNVTMAERLPALCLAAAIAASAFYVSGILATAETTPRAGAVVRTSIRTAYGLAVLEAVMGSVLPAAALNDYGMGVADPGALSRSGFWLGATVWILVVLVFCLGWGVLARQQIDKGEHARAVCNALAVPFLVCSTFLPYRLAVLSFFVATVVILFGLFRHFAAQGERGVFLSRFLSPQVSEMVRSQGLAAVMRPREVELTVVCCDLRGFTAYAEAVPSQAVIDLLREYYDAVGKAVAEVNGTVKDFAGDGVLVLVGAPLSRPDHAGAGLALASRMLEIGRQVTDHWSTRPHPLGLGVGVASGVVTVGAIESTGRTEYTAVGTPVNLAARLCSSAGDGEILVDERTVELAGADELEPRGAMVVKGLSGDVPVYAVPASGSM